MRIALVTTPAASAGGALRELLPHLRAGAEVALFVEPGRASEEGGAERLRSLVELAPREHDQILYALANERACGFMLPAIRALGGTVLLGGWRLDEAARGAYPSLARAGLRGFRRALAEGGLVQARVWARGAGLSPVGAGSIELALNRSAVRFGDAFLVHEQLLRERILAERNERTPIALVPRALAGADADPESIARLYLDALAQFPHARSARRSLVVLAFRARSAARQARAEAREGGANA